MADPLRFFVEPTLRDAPLVLAFEGWNDAGGSASMAARFLQRALGAVPLAEIDGEDFFDLTVRRPRVEIDAGGLRRIEWPRTEFHYGSADAARELVLGLGAEPHLRWRAFCDHVVALVRALRLRRIVLLGAYLADVVYSRPVEVSGFASKPDLLDALSVARSGYAGPTGIPGVLAARLREEGLEVISLWAALPHYIHAAPNPRGALALLEKLSACLDLDLDVAPLRTEATDFEQRMNHLVTADPDLSEYVRQLKRREFAQ